MKRAAYDLHIHSCLSPCASDDMTPANIAAMAKLKGLSVIALTDHNCGFNLEAMYNAAFENGLVFVPGIEVSTREEVHVLAYFPSLAPALNFSGQVYQSLPDISNKPGIFGNQIIMDCCDRPSGYASKLLLQASSYSIEETVKMARELGGCAVPAHINRDSFSVISNLGFLPDGLFSYVEICRSIPCPPVSEKYGRLFSSDAHTLGDISEPENYISDVLSAQDFINLININILL